MIRLRDTFERGRAHPVLGPLLLVVLVLLLAMVFLHVAYEGMEAATGMGALCVALAGALGLLVIRRLFSRPPLVLICDSGGRSPPEGRRITATSIITSAASLSSIPLRR